MVRRRKTPIADSRTEYETFLNSKLNAATDGGFAPISLPDFLFPFQTALVDWALRKGRSAIFANCGLGKSPMQLVWADNVVRHTNKPVLLLTPLAVTGQMVREAEKFGIEAHRSHSGEVRTGINIANYERLHHFNQTDFSGVVCDESSILKSFEGDTRKAITDFMRVVPYRLLCTATPSPNDFVELGTSSDALGYLGFMDMLGRFFKNARNNASLGRAWASQGGGSPQWRFRGHAEKPFWRWVCSWARAVTMPSDLNFSDDGFVLSPLLEREHVIASDSAPDGMLFSVPAVGLSEERQERRRTMRERCAKVASLVSDTGAPAVCWAHLNDEADMLEALIPDAIQVSGRDIDEAKEEKFAAFERGQARVLVTKPVIGAWGLNWQHCAHTTMFSGHSFEQYYQSVRRFWRFGQKQTVVVDHVLGEGETRVLANLRRKSEQAERMFRSLAQHIGDEMQIARGRVFSKQEEVPSWLLLIKL